MIIQLYRNAIGEWAWALFDAVTPGGQPVAKDSGYRTEREARSAAEAAERAHEAEG